MIPDRENVAGGAREIDLAAADWLQRRQFWNWTDSDQAALDAWIAQSDAHRIAYLRQSAVWKSTNRLVVLREPARAAEAPKKSARPYVIGTALALLVAACGAGAWMFLVQPGSTTYSTAIGGHRMIALGDGSSIELNTDSSARVEAKGGARRVTLLRGEAYFEIRHDAAHPFSVAANNYRIIDLGTKFVVRDTEDHVEVSLVEGRARVQTASLLGPVQSAIMTPGDVVVAAPSYMTMTRKPLQQIADDLGWRRQVLVFKGVTLEGAAAEFNRYNAEKLVLASRDVAGLKINGTFEARNIDLFAESAKELFGLHIAKIGDETVISR
ncbi:MAG TPA: FecR domain-containing protein [Rhizomicrobium sp.]|jgi:transmembrane sensor|nr:FecR domain-containing protein [Rhizomicrobium sp.]